MSDLSLNDNIAKRL